MSVCSIGCRVFYLFVLTYIIFSKTGPRKFRVLYCKENSSVKIYTSKKVKV